MTEQLPSGDAASSLLTVGGLERFVLGSSEPTCLADRSGRVLHANPAYRRIEPFIAAADRMTADEISLAVEAVGSPFRHEIVVEPEGRLERYMAERLVVHDGQGRISGSIGRFVRMDRHDRAMQACLLAEGQLEDAVRLIPGWLWETDRDHRLTYVAPKVYRDLGHLPSDLVGRPFRDLLETAPWLETVPDLPRPGTLRDVPAAIRHKDGSLRRVHLNAVAVFDPRTGAFEGYRGMAHAVSEAGGRQSVLLKIVEEASAASQAKSRFLADMSHELRTPLNAIMGFSEAMKLELLGPLGQEKYREYAEDILASSRHLLNLIGDILDISKIEAGRVDIDESEFAVADLLDHAYRIVAERAGRAGIDLRVHVAAELPMLRGDERRLRQVLLNLLWNAIKFTPPGGRITLAADRGEDAGLEIVVADTGIGMEPGDIATAMAPFGQLHAGGPHKGEGTGLGLPLAKALVELHGGRLELESRPGVGTTARVLLPADRLRRAGGSGKAD